MPSGFIPIALVLTLTPGPATALVVRRAVAGGTREAFRTVVGNATGVAGWALLSALGVAALVIAFDFAWYLTLAALVSRARRAVAVSRLARRLEQVTGAVLLALAGRLALEHR